MVTRWRGADGLTGAGLDAGGAKGVLGVGVGGQLVQGGVVDHEPRAVLLTHTVITKGLTNLGREGGCEGEGGGGGVRLIN